jgi:hypothetical protein
MAWFTLTKQLRLYKCRFSAHGRDDGYLSHAMLKYGKENFAISCVIKCNSWEEMNAKEKFCIRIFNSLAPNGYNLTTGGDANQVYSKETRKKMSKEHVNYLEKHVGLC